LLYRVAIRFLYFKIFSSESLHERVVVSKMIPRTFPQVEFENAMSKDGQFCAKAIPRSLQVALYWVSNELPSELLALET
jgi:hypothetical protein